MSGFVQKVFSDISLEGRPELWNDDEDSLDKNLERILFLSSFPQTAYNDQLDISKSTTRKNEMLSKALKEKGNKSYGAGNNIEAMNLYNQALCFCSQEKKNDGGDGHNEMEGKEASLLFANRSALWAELGEHALVEEDVRLALMTGYPDNLKYKLLERRSKSRCVMENFEEASTDASEAVQCLDSSTLDANKKKEKLATLKKLQNHINKSLKSNKKNKNTDTEDNKTKNGEQSDKKSDKSEKIKSKKITSCIAEFKAPNSQFPSFCDAVSIKYARGRGRYAVAARDIKLGELIARETAHVAVVDKEHSKTHCWHCLLVSKNPLPCFGCSGVIFCSLACREEACSTYHRYECMHTDILYKAQLGAWYLAYRALTSLPWKFYVDNKDKFIAHDEKAGVGDSGMEISSQDIMSFHNLVTHDGVTEKAAPELMMQCHVTVFLVRTLIATGYLTGNTSVEFNKEQMLCSQLIHHFMRAAYFNTHEICDIEKTGDRWDQNKIRRIGRVTNPSLALINHSCDPNYRRISHGKITFGFASKPIPRGHEITDIYCKPFSGSPIEERHRSLAKYNFRCECLACGNNWPTMEGMQGDFDRLPPRMYNQPTNKVEAQVKRVTRAEDQMRKITGASSSGPGDIITCICHLLEEGHKLVKQPHQTLVTWENHLHQALFHAHAAKVTTIRSGSSTVTWPWEA